MPYFSGPNGIREVADPGERFLQSFQDSRKKRLLSDYFSTGNIDLGALGQLDPETAAKVQADQRERQAGGALAKLFQAPEDQRQGILAQVMGLNPTMGLQAAKVFDPRFANGGTPSELQTFNAMTQGMGSDDISEAKRIQLGLAPRKSSAAIQYKETTLPDGRKAWVAFDPREVGSQIMGTGETYGSGVGASKPYQPGTVVGTPGVDATRVNIQGMDPAKQGQIANAVKAMQAAGIDENTITAFVTSQLEGGAQSGGAGSLVGPSEAQLAANKRAAEAGVDLQYQPQLEQAKADVQYGNMGRVGEMDARNAGMTTAAQESARVNSAVAAKAGQRQRDNRESLLLLKEAAELLPGATSGGLQTAGKGAAGYFGMTTAGGKNDGRLNIIAGTLTSKVPRFEGPQSDKDTAAYREMAGDLANTMKPVGERIASLRGMIKLIDQYQKSQAQQPAASGGYKVGQIIQQGGKRYRVTGGDMSDPDVEEVR